MNEKDEILFLPGKDFLIVHKYTEMPDNSDFVLHNHDDIYEIVLLLDGNCDFLVEGNTYKIKPHDIVFTRPFELHRIVCRPNKPYERIILYLHAEYFEQHDCTEFLDIFTNRELGTDNVASHNISGACVADCMERIFRYYNDGAVKVAENSIIEFLYLLNGTKSVSKDFYAQDERIRSIIMYINNHLTDAIKLDDLSKRFFINKHYLCKTFKKSTGYTVNRYINYKRILLAQELHRNGKSLLQSSLDAGFNSYAHFYKMYVKQIGKPPKSMG